jgi:hypothetical protein
MPKTAWSFMVLFAFIAGLVLAGLQSSPVAGQRVNPAVDSGPRQGELIAISNSSPTGQQLLLVDPRLKVICVYQVDRSSGQITLKSVRNVHWDMMMDEFNGVSPSPRDIRAILHR